MKSSTTFFICLLLVLGLLFLSCTRSVLQTAYPALHDGRYDSEFPYKNSSKQLEKITQSVQRILCMTYYDDYLYTKDDSLIVKNINASTFRQADRKRSSLSTVAGTATLIAQTHRKVLMLSAAHVFDRPDTVISYHKDERLDLPFLVQSISVINRLELISPDFRDNGPIRIIHLEPETDIALLVKEFEAITPPMISVMQYPFGRAKDLEWGSFVYLIGCPKGHKVITKGIVSSPDRDKHHSFILDALFNRGFSGGIILGIRDGIPNFELVGMATSSYSDDEKILVPDDNARVDQFMPYDGPVFVSEKKQINYGLSIATSAESIRNVLQKYKQDLEAEGFEITPLLSPKEPRKESGNQDR